MNTSSFISSDFLSTLPLRDRSELLALAQRRTYRRQEFIFQVGSPCENVYVLSQGRVKIFGLSALGKEVIMWFCLPGEVFGLAEMPRAAPREVYAQASVDCEVYAVPLEAFRGFLSTRPATAMAVIDLLSRRLRVLGDMLQNLTSDDVTTRVAKLLLRLCGRYGKRVPYGVCLDLPITHQEMADMIGATRQTVTTVIGELKRMGAVRVENHQFWIQREDLLEHIVSQARASTVPAGDH